jgi:hypothetical protein
MHTVLVKATLMVGWVLAVGVLGYMSGTTSVVGWTLLAVVALVPAALVVRLWSVPPPSMSETIRDVLR